MPQLQSTEKETTLFPFAKWNSQIPLLAEKYQQNRPIPHVFLPGFLDLDLAKDLAHEFPAPSTEAWIHYQHHNENKLGMTKRELFPPCLGAVADELNSPEFLIWLSELTGIPGLLADPSLEGGGLHQSGPGGFLNVHTDFSHHHYHKNWRRRVNLILYLNPNWQESWGGAIELWDKEMRHCVTSLSPKLNHALIFNTSDISFHGFPEPLKCPQGVSRKSLAFYYYTEDRGHKPHPRSTNYRARPEDGVGQKAMIWLDKVAVDLYSRAKTQFGFSDEFASRVLGLISGKK